MWLLTKTAKQSFLISSLPVCHTQIGGTIAGGSKAAADATEKSGRTKVK